MKSDFSLGDLCDFIAEVTHLEEGPPGVESILRQIHQFGPVSPRDLAGAVGLPIPLISAVRRELEKLDLLDRKGGMILSSQGRKLTEPQWGDQDSGEETGSASAENSDANSCSVFEQIASKRPPVDRRWDQSHATLETAVKRAELFLDRGWIQGKRVLFLGDDDLTSIGTLLLFKERLGKKAMETSSVSVLEIDTRLVEFLQQVAREEDLPLVAIQADLRESVPSQLAGSFDFFFTDPPYTSEGVNLFLDRGCQALDPEGMRKAALAVPLSPPSLQLATQEAIIKKGFAIDYLTPGFNHYIGGTMHGGISALVCLQLLRTDQFSAQTHEGPLYTAET